MDDRRWKGQVKLFSGIWRNVEFDGPNQREDSENQAKSMYGATEAVIFPGDFTSSHRDNQVKHITSYKTWEEQRREKTSGSSISSEPMSFGTTVAIGIFIIGGVSAIAYLPFVLSGVLGWFGTKTALSIDKRDTAFKNMQNTFLAKTYMVLILSAVFGGVGFLGGEYIEKNYMGDGPQELRNNLKYIFKD